MGGVPLLLMAIAMGITYGWQPDGRGGVDYIIQVPPDQVNEVLRSGEISSVIDPAVRGHVSRVIIRVGNDPLPRDTPAHLSGSKSASDEIVQANVSDRTPMRKPELVQMQGPNVVMKPQTGGLSAGMGLPDSLTDAAASANAAAARAGNGLRDSMTDLSAELAAQERARQQQRIEQAQAAAAAAAGRANPLAGPNARGSIGQDTTAGGPFNPAKLPAFTGDDRNTGMNSVRTGVPSTDPTSARDKQWFQVNAKSDARTPSTDPINRQAGWPETVGPPDPRATQDPTSRATMQPLGSTANFAHVPGAAGFSNAAGQVPATTEMTEYERAEQWRRLQLQQQAENARRVAQSSRGGFAANLGSDPLATQNSSMGFPDPRGAARQDYDPRLTPAEAAMLPIGAWSRDKLGNAIDQVGRILDESGRMVSAQRAYELRNPSLSTTATLDRPLMNSPAQPNRTGLNQSGFSPAGFDERIARADSFAAGGQFDSLPRDTGRPTQAIQPPATNSPSDRDLSASRYGNSDRVDYSASGFDSTRRRTTLAAQPLFNGLLLMSIVANVYLIVWLKNLRYQFSDMVASKRAAASDIAV